MFKKIVIASHVFSPGTSQGLQGYFLKKGAEVLFIGHPLFANFWKYFFDALDIFWKVFRSGKKYDLYVGSNNLNAFVGIILRGCGRAKKVIFFTPDYSEKRFGIAWIDKIYLWMDYFCLRKADLVWNSSSIMPFDFMAQAREKRGVPQKYRDKQISVPDGTDDMPQTPFEQIHRYEAGFVGHLKEGMGVELLIEVFPEIKKKIPEFKLIIIGGGPRDQEFRRLAKGYPDIEFTGFVGDLKDVYQILSKSAIALAPYECGTISEYTDPGKVKNYLSIGLPIVITKVPRIALEIDKEKCGIAIDHNKDQLISALEKILLNDKILREYRINAYKMADKYRWEKVFDRALGFLE